jgi:hypothetical protein
VPPVISAPAGATFNSAARTVEYSG